jgi:hypothetical protein
MNLHLCASRRAFALTAWALAACLSACGEGSSSGSRERSAGTESVRSAVERLEASGELPVLDRTDSLAGIDANANGVRDDIERYIEKKYTEPAQRKAAMQTARGFQQMLLVNTSDAVALDAASERGSRALTCRSAVFPGVEGIPAWTRMSSDLEAMTANTKQRLLAYLAYNKARSGTVSTLLKGNTCD